jgi:hypothetical protein
MRQVKAFAEVPLRSMLGVWRDALKVAGGATGYRVAEKVPESVHLQALAVSASYLKVAKCGA